MAPIIQIVLPAYGFLTVIGFTAAFIILYMRSRSKGLSLLNIVQTGIFAILGLAVGSRILFAVTSIPEMIAHPENIAAMIIGGGFVFYGGLFGAMGALLLYCRLKKLDRAMVFNIIVPCFPLFHFFGRIGCFMSGCCYGIPCSFGFEMVSAPGVLRFPVQLAEAVCNVIILIVLLVLERKRPHTDLLKVYLLSYAICRFILEFLRGDEIRGIWLFLSTSQWISLGIIIFIAVKTLLSRNKKAPVEASPEQPEQLDT